MPAVVLLRRDFDPTTLREVAKRCPDSRQTRRLLALAAVYDGMNGGFQREVQRLKQI